MASYVGYTLAAVITAVALQVLPLLFRDKFDLEIQGQVDPQFSDVKDVFKNNFVSGSEYEGAAFAVYHKGKLVVDIWGGYADFESNKKWAEDTLTVIFSSTKAVAALCAAILVDRGHLDYDQLVTHYWPEFGQNGKDNVTVRMLLSHEAGLAAFDEKITMETIRDWRKMSAAMEMQKPNWPPGTAYGYHAVSYGWVVDQILRRADPSKRGLSEFFRQEIGDKYDIHDFSVGVDMAKWYRMARTILPNFWHTLQAFEHLNYALYQAQIYGHALVDAIRGGGSILMKVFSNPDFLFIPGSDFNHWNHPATYTVEIAGANGVATARDLAKIFSLFDHLVKNESLKDKLFVPINGANRDMVMNHHLVTGWGFFHTKNPQGDYIIGHPGYGGQNVKFDRKNQLAFAYVRNGLTPTIGEQTKAFTDLQAAVYAALKLIPEQKSK